MSRPVEPVAAVLRAPEMRPYALGADAALADGRLNVHDLRLFYLWRRWRRDQKFVGTATLAEIQDFCRDKRSTSRLQQLFRSLICLDPSSPDLPAIRQARLLQERLDRPGLQHQPRRPPPRRVSVHEAALPANWQAMLNAMRRGRPGPRGHRAPAPMIISSISQKLCQLAFSAEAAGLPVALAPEPLAAWITAMTERGLAGRTIVSSLGKIRVFLQHLGGHQPLDELLKGEIQFHSNATVGVPKKKEIFLEQTGLNLLDIAAAAAAALQEAQQARQVHSRQRLANEAALFAVALVAAPRLADIETLVIERTVFRDARGWRLCFATSKTAEPYRLRIDPRLTRFVDAAILHGVDETFIATLYQQRRGTALFVSNALNEPLCYWWATKRFHRRVGIGLHIVRSLWHDRGHERGPLGLEEALAVCGQRSAESRLHYRTEHGRRAVTRRAVNLLNDIGAADDEQP